MSQPICIRLPSDLDRKVRARFRKANLSAWIKSLIERELEETEPLDEHAARVARDADLLAQRVRKS